MAKLGSRASYGGTVVENISAAKTLDPSDSGKVFTLDLDGTFSFMDLISSLMISRSCVIFIISIPLFVF